MFHPHFHYDQIASSSCVNNNNNNNNENLLQIKPKSEDITPASSEFEFCTNDATKGSTINELGSDDEEATIAVTPTAIFGSEQELTTKIDNLELNQMELQTSDLSDASPVIASTSKIDNKLHSKIQKQISLFEKDVSTQSKNLSQEAGKYVEMPFNIKQDQNIQNRHQDCDKFYSQPPRFISAEDLEKYTPNVEKNLSSINKFGVNVEKCAKVKSCVNLKLTNPSTSAENVLNNHLPGALMVRESYIEPPKVNYIKKQTDYLNIEVNQLHDSVIDDKNLNITNYQASTSSSSAALERKPSRFTTTFVSEDAEKSLKNLKKKNNDKNQ